LFKWTFTQNTAYSIAIETLLNPANQVDPFYITYSDISKIVAVKGRGRGGLNVKYLGGP
jgi:hypothetical protein